MSFDIYLCAWQDGRESPFPLAIVEEALGRFAEWRDETRWVLSFPDGGTSNLYVGDEPQTSFLSVNRPASSPELWQGMFEILRRTTSVLIRPGGGGIVADASAIAKLVPDIVRTAEEITVVTEPAQIPRRISGDQALHEAYARYVSGLR